MKLIIDISDKMLDAFKKHGIMTFDNLDEYDRDMIADAISNGTPLPKGHGRLIDAHVLKDKVASWLKPEKPDETEMISLDNALVSTIMEIEEAETIIEADMRAEDK